MEAAKTMTLHELKALFAPKVTEGIPFAVRVPKKLRDDIHKIAFIQRKTVMEIVNEALEEALREANRRAR